MLRTVIYGTGCNRTLAMRDKVLEAASLSHMDLALTMVQDLDRLVERKIAHTPALEIEGRIAITGRVPFIAELIELFSSSGKATAEDGVMRINPPAEKAHDTREGTPLSLKQSNPVAMRSSNIWIVGLDFTKMDKAVIEYTASMAEVVDPKKIYFIHVYPDLDLPDSAREALAEPDMPIDERLRAEMEAQVRLEFPDCDRYHTEFLIAEGKPEAQILRWSHIKNADLLVMGRKKRVGGSGVVPKRVARKAACSILFVPEVPSFNLKTFLVPTDFSSHSGIALDTASWIKDRVQGAEIFLFHSCHLPSSIYYDGLAGSNMVDLLQEAAEEQMDELKDKHDAPDCRVMVDCKTDISVAHAIAEAAEEIPADLVILGGKGRTGLTGALIGSVTESLLQALEEIPVWVSKQDHAITAESENHHVGKGQA